MILAEIRLASVLHVVGGSAQRAEELSGRIDKYVMRFGYHDRIIRAGSEVFLKDEIAVLTQDSEESLIALWNANSGVLPKEIESLYRSLADGRISVADCYAAESIISPGKLKAGTRLKVAGHRFRQLYFKKIPFSVVLGRGRQIMRCFESGFFSNDMIDLKKDISFKLIPVMWVSDQNRGMVKR